MLRIGMRSDGVCLTVALDASMLSWFNLLLLGTGHMHKDESLEPGCRCIAAAALLLMLYCCTLLLRLLG